MTVAEPRSLNLHREKTLPSFLQQPEARETDHQGTESPEEITEMYVKMVLRNKRFRPTSPVRESTVSEENISELAIESKYELRADQAELDVLAVQKET